MLRVKDLWWVIVIFILSMGLRLFGEVLNVPVPRKGIVNKYDSTMIIDDACQDAINVNFDRTGGAHRRCSGGCSRHRF